MEKSGEHQVFVTTATIAGPRNREEIAPRKHGSALLESRREEIDAAIRQACAVLKTAADQAPTGPGWQVSTIEATFGLTIGVEAGVLISKASADATFEISITIGRTGA